MDSHHHPDFGEMPAEAARALLARNHVGRIAYSLHDRVDIQPVNYVFDDGWIVGRTRIGSKLLTLAHHPWCAFEVDEVRDVFDWDSVVVRGSFSILDPEVASPDRYQRAITSLRELIPGAFTNSDPVPARNILFSIYASEISGRLARP